MCRYDEQCDDVCAALEKTADGATTVCCGTLIPESHIGGQPAETKHIWDAVCDTCGLLARDYQTHDFPKRRVREHRREHPDHSADWMEVRV